MKSISTKLVLTILATLVASLLCITVFHTVKTRDLLIHNKFEEKQAQTELIMGTMNAKISDLKSDTIFLSETPPIKGILRAKLNKGSDTVDDSSIMQWEERLTTIFTELLRAKPHYSQIRYIGTANNGKEILRVDRRGNHIFRSAQEDLQEKGDRKYFKEAIKITPNNVYLSEINLNQDYGKITIPYELTLRAAVPIYSSPNNVFGIVIINMNYNKTILDLTALNEKNTEYVFLNNQNQILLHSNFEINRFIDNEKLKHLDTFYPISSLLDKSTHENIIEFDNKLITTSELRYNKLNYNDSLKLVVLVDKSNIISQVNSNLLGDTAIIFLISILMIFISYLYIRNIVAPIKQLRKLTQHFINNKEIPEEMYKVNSKDEIGELTHILISMSRDILEMNNLLKVQQYALDASAIVAETDLKGKITYVNDNFCKISGYSRGELLGKDHRVLNSSLHPKKFFKNMWDTIQSGNVWHGEIRNRKKNGDYYWVDSTLVPFVDNSGMIKKYVAIRFDITGKKEQELYLKEAAQSKANFLATMSHEIRTPLNGVIGMATLLKEEKLSEDGKKYVATMLNSGQDLLNLINDILDFSKIEAGKINLESINFNFDETISHVVSLFYPKAKEKGLKLTIKRDNNAPEWLTGDPSRLKQVVSNLISNSIKFTEKGQIEISYSLKSFDRGEYTFQVSISDTGIGMDKKALQRVFNQFEQADNSTSRNYGGSGLGLAISRSICTAMGGNIWVESNPGKGSTFFFTMRFKKGNSINFEGHNLPKDNSIKIAETNPLSLLVADDNSTNRLIIKKFLEQFGYEADIVNDGKEVLKAIALKSYDAILLDIHMPELDGYEVTKTIRSISRESERPWIVALTASASAEDKNKCFKVGMNDFVSKPVTKESLLSAILRIKKELLLPKH